METLTTPRLFAGTSAMHQELVDAIAAAVDTGRLCEVDRLVRVADRLGFGEPLREELRLVGVDSLGEFEEVEF